MKPKLNWRLLLPPCALVLAGVAIAINSGPAAKGHSASSNRSQPKPSPTPRRPLPKPSVARGFEHFAHRDASARLIAGSATRPIIDPDNHYAIGEGHYRAGRYKKAVAELRQAVQHHPEFDDSHYVLALALTELGQLKEAIEEFKRVIALAKSDDPKILSYYNMGNAHADLGDYEPAVESYQQAIKLDPTLSKPHNNLGLAYAALGRTQEAAAEFTEAVRHKKDYADAHYNLGVVLVLLGKKPPAAEQQRILVKLGSELAERLDRIIKQ
jgi:tetratricopeptide (TPR) repeat protein